MLIRLPVLLWRKIARTKPAAEVQEQEQERDANA